MKYNQIDKAISNAIEKINVPDLSNLLFDGKGEIELNRRLSISLEREGYLSRVEVSVPEAKGERTHTDIVIFDANQNVIACIECKSCITPDVYQRKAPNNNFSRLKKDTEKYALNNYSPLYIIMWTVHWESFPKHEASDFKHFKYFKNHKRMHIAGFKKRDLEKSIQDAIYQVKLGNIIHQSTIGPFDKWRNCKASVIATLARTF